MLAKASSSMRMTGLAPRVSPAAVVAPSRRSAVQVVAAEAQNKKRTPQPVSAFRLGKSMYSILVRSSGTDNPTCARPCVGRLAAPAHTADVTIVPCNPAHTAFSSQVKRAQLAEERRMSNKGRKSAIATRIKKVRRQ
jgi:hypothetical protein